eukprot:c21833_g1_i3 orf=289-1521(+)
MFRKSFRLLLQGTPAISCLQQLRQQLSARRVSFASASCSSPAEGIRLAALWGNGDHGRLGLASTVSHWEPRLCNSLQDRDLVAVSCGGAHTLFLTATGQVFATGLNDCGQLGISLETPYVTEPREVAGLPVCAHIAAGYHHSAAISDDGEVFVWGDNSHGQLGLGKGARRIQCRPCSIESLKGLSLKAVAFGSEHSLALTDDGKVLSWGTGKHGQLGHSLRPSAFRFFQNMSEYSPRLIKHLQDTQIQKISAGLLHSACVDDNGGLYTFGKGMFSQLGIEKELMEPYPVIDLPPVKHVACGGYHTGAVTRTGNLYMWGTNEYGCLGLGDRCENQTRIPMKVEGRLAGLHVTEISCGWKHTSAVCGNQITGYICILCDVRRQKSIHMGMGWFPRDILNEWSFFWRAVGPWE